MCLAVPGKVISVSEKEAVVDYGREQRKVKIAASNFSKGDYVLVQQGFVVAKVEESEALEMIQAWEETGCEIP